MKRALSMFAILCLIVSCCAVFSSCGETAEQKVQKAVDEINSQIGPLQSSMGDTAEYTVKADGTAIDITIKYKIDVGDTATAKATIASSMESQSSSFEKYATEAKNAGVTDPSVVVRVLDKDGNELYTKTFK